MGAIFQSLGRTVTAGVVLLVVILGLASALTGDLKGAEAVELVLPQTGVCSGGSDCCDGVDCGSAESSCCGTSDTVIPLSALTAARP